MKKLLAILLAAMMIFALGACGNNETPSGSEGDKPGTSQTDNQGGASKKADNAQMAAVPADAHENLLDAVNKIETNSGLSGIGMPPGFEYGGSGSSGNALSVGFRDESIETVSDDTLTAYAAAIWNMCIDIADDGALSKRTEGITSLEDAAGKNDEGYLAYTWYYYINGVKYRIKVEIDTYKSNTIKLWSEKYE